MISAMEMSRYCGTIQARWSSLGGLGAWRTAASSRPRRSRTHNTYTPPMRTNPSPEPLTSPSALSTRHLNLHQMQRFFIDYKVEKLAKCGTGKWDFGKRYDLNSLHKILHFVCNPYTVVLYNYIYYLSFIDVITF